MKTTALLLVLFVGGLPDTVLAQIKGVHEGDHIRITAPAVSDSIITGQVDSITQDRILVTGVYSPNSWTEIPINAIEQLEIRKEVRKTGRGALVGGGIGAFTIGIITLASNESCDPDDQWCTIEFSDGEAFLMGAAAGSLAGVVIGAIIGSASKGEKWERIPVEITSTPLSVRMFDRNNRHALGIKLTWSF
ncbi:hypothetical protein ACG2F4_15055 [Halalkalibaculum sp. DA3122]|uniref:hypothetical protein n=1 Tax=unclassified Halalkalibaculum TaxID=2964617 RepID=UPI003755322B